MSETNQPLTVSQAYQAMYAFLSRFNVTYKSDDVAILLSGLDTLPDGRPFVDAYWIEWLESVDLARSGKVDTALKLQK